MHGVVPQEAVVEVAGAQWDTFHFQLAKHEQAVRPS